ncbi:hypothetical protein RUND412_004209 [Rhizina undulata]
MALLKSLISFTLLLAIGSNAFPSKQFAGGSTFGQLNRRANSTNSTNSSCTNTATSRSCWSDGYDLSTDYYSSWPSTGVVREYWLEVQNGTAAPDGYERTVLTFNGSYPGPTLYADWGDLVRVHVTNALANNGTSIHWHGIRQYGSNEQDGVNGVTQCPIAPGDSLTYEWNATQYGTSWYHSHFSLQYAEGVAGAIIVNGPASADYDVDLGSIMLTDWYHNTAFSLWDQAHTNPNPEAQNGLINGTNTYDCAGSTDSNCASNGTRFETTLTKGQKYRMRFINTAVDTMFKLGIDNHTFTVISADFVPIVPYDTTYLTIGIGQRYDVIVEANQTVDNYWFHAYIQTSCSSTNENTMNVKGIIRYDGASTTADPTTTDPMTGYVDSCADETLSSLVPYVSKDVTSTSFDTSFDELDVDITLSNGIFNWRLNGTSLVIDWGTPTLLELMDGNSYPTAYNTVELPDGNTWVFFVIETALGVTHPIHLHGHDFYILSQGTGTFNSSTSDINFTNPMRRDVAMLPASGYLVIAFLTDNPGIWLMHCHIAWHVSEGLAIQFVERANDILDTITIGSSWNDTCTAWDSYDNGSEVYAQDDSGLRKFKF